MISFYLGCCFVWFLNMLLETTDDGYNIKGWRHPISLVLFPATFVAIITSIALYCVTSQLDKIFKGK